MARKIIAVVVSIIIWGALWVGGNAVIRAIEPDAFEDQITSDPTLLGASIGLSVVLSLLAGFLCARIAGGKRVMKVVATLAVIQLAIGIGVQSTVWDDMPLWYHVTFLGLVAPMHLVGGLLGRSAG